jgi:hypothetical protein
VDEPIIQWEPQGGEYCVDIDGKVYENCPDDECRLFGVEYSPKIKLNGLVNR